MSYDFDDELLSAYLDDELSAEERAAVERLLTDRPEARRLLEELRQVQESVRSLPTLRLGDDFESSVLRHAEREVLRASPHADGGGDSGAGSRAQAVSGATGFAASEPAPTVVPARLSAGGILPSGDALGDRGLIEDWQRSGRWRRPLAWSIMATAAAVVFMYVDSQQHANRALVLHQPNADKSTTSSTPAVAAAPGVAPTRPTELHARDEQAGGGFAQAVPVVAGSAPTLGDGGPLGKVAAVPGDAMKGEALKSASNGAADKWVGQFAVENRTPSSAIAMPNASSVPAASGTLPPPAPQMSVFNAIPPTAGPQPAIVVEPSPSSPAATLPSASPAVPPPANVAAASSKQSRFAIVDTLPTAAGVGGNAVGGGSASANPQFMQPLAPTNDMATQIVSQAVSQQYGYGSYGEQVDTTPLVAANDYRRAQSLLSDYEALRRRSPDAKQAVDSLRQRLRATEETEATRLAARKLAADAVREPLSEAAAKSIAKNSLSNDDSRKSTNDERLVIVYCDVTPEAWERGLAPVLRREQIADLTALQAPSAYAASPNPKTAGPTELQQERADVAADRQNRTSSAEREEFYYVVAGKPQLAAALDALRNQSEYFLNVEVEPASSAAGEQVWRTFSRGQNVRGTSREPLRDAGGKRIDEPAAASVSRSKGNEFADGKEPQANPSVALQMPASREVDRLQTQVRQQGLPLSRAQRIVPAAIPSEAIDQATLGQTASTVGKLQSSTSPTSGEGKFGNEAPRGAVGGGAAPSGGTLVDARRASAKPAGPAVDSAAKKTDVPPTGDVPIAEKSQLPDNQPSDGRATRTELAKREAESRPAGETAATVWLGLPDDFHEALFIFRVIDQAAQPASNARPATEAKPADDASRK